MNATTYYHVEQDEELKFSLSAGHSSEKLHLEITTNQFSSITIIAPRDVMIDALTDAFDRFIDVGEPTPEEAEKTAVTL